MGLKRSYPEDLLEQGRHLAARERTRPRQVSLRRAVSNAYYAIFHLLILDAVARWRVADQRPALGRVFEHGRMKNAALRAVNASFEGYPPHLAAHLRYVGRAFCGAYDDRQSADYDNAAVWSRLRVTDRLDSIQQAFDAWKAIRDTRLADDFLLSLLVKER